jgi:hypothetical protein
MIKLDEATIWKKAPRPGYNPAENDDILGCDVYPTTSQKPKK